MMRSSSLTGSHRFGAFRISGLSVFVHGYLDTVLLAAVGVVLLLSATIYGQCP